MADPPHPRRASASPRDASPPAAPGADGSRAPLDHLRRLACCASEPECILCPLRPENAHLSLRELAAAGLRGGPDRVPET